MSQWARANPERMEEISHLPLDAQNEALRDELRDLERRFDEAAERALRRFEDAVEERE